LVLLLLYYVASKAVVDDEFGLTLTNSDLVLKVIMVGNAGVGKSCLLKAFKGDTFDMSYTSTIGYGNWRWHQRVLYVAYSWCLCISHHRWILLVIVLISKSSLLLHMARLSIFKL
jgi:hypothetical protein